MVRGSRNSVVGIAAVAACITLVAFLTWNISAAPADATKEAAPTGTASSTQGLVTPNTVRVFGANVFASPTAVTQLTYGATHHEDRPHAVSLARTDRKADAMLAASRITHFPVNCPVLYVEEGGIPPETLAELKRLQPDGNTYDGKVKIYLVGPVGPTVEREVQEKLGWKTRAFRSADPVSLSEELDTWAAAVHTDHPDEVVIVQLRALDSGLPAVAWNAHMGHGLAFVDGDTVPEATKRILQRRYRGRAYIYLFGDSEIISEKVAQELSSYGHVQRVRGKDPYEISVTFAGFRDAGLNEGYWVRWSNRDFGWGIAEAGHNFTFVTAEDWQLAVTGSLLSHMGKHGPMILLPRAGLNPRIAGYLESVRPAVASPSDQLTNHAWILGTPAAVSRETQLSIDSLLEPGDVAATPAR
jgi:hypothetical protein